MPDDVMLASQIRLSKFRVVLHPRREGGVKNPDI